jgi:hypothetical protein
MKKVVLVFAAAAFMAFITGGGVACAAVGGHGQEQVNIETVTVTRPPEAVREKVGANEVTIVATPPLTPPKAVIAQNFGSASSVAVFPDVKAQVSTGGTAKIAFTVETKSLLDTFEASAGATVKAAEVKLVLWHTNETDFTEYTYAASRPLSAQASTAKADPAKTFTFVDEDGEIVTELESGKEVYPLFDVKDGSPEDVDPEDGSIEVRPSAVFAREGSNDGEGGGGGCDAGFFGAFGASLSLLAAGWFLFKKRGA